MKSPLDDHLIEIGADIFEIAIFLIAAMSLVEILAHYNFFDIIRGKLYALKLNDKKQFVIIGIITFFLSAIIDNLTTAIVMTQISKKFFKGSNLLVAASAVIIAANAGGAFSPLGDVTTIMLWLAEKFTALEIIRDGFMPSIVLFGIAIMLLYPQIKNENGDNTEELVTKLSRSEKLVIGITFGSFSLPLVMSYVGLPPYFGLLIGLGLVWIIIDIFKQISQHTTHLQASLEHLIQKIDIASIKFFVGVLLAVSGMEFLGILEEFSHWLYTTDPSVGRIIAGNVSLGFVSAILDNVPLTAITIEALKTTSSSLWVLLVLTVGTGGSFLIIGSAAGVVVMGMIKELTFNRYFKITFFANLAAYTSAIIVWYLWMITVHGGVGLP